MKQTTKLQNRFEEAIRLRTLSVIFASEAIILGFFVVYSGMIRGWFGNDTISLAFLPLLFTLITSISTYILASLQLKVCEEEEEHTLLQKRKEKSALEISEDVLFISKRSLSLFLKFSPYVICTLKFLSALVFLILYYNYIKKRIDTSFTIPENYAQAAFVSAIFSIICLFSGVFAIGQSRESNFRWLRVTGSWLIMSSAIFAASSIALLLTKASTSWDSIFNYDQLFRKIFFVFLSVSAIELFVNFIMEFYRPRGETEERPVFESRILALFSEPGGLMKNIADTLDYQFGFRISSTWLYKFLENAIIPLLIFWALTLWLITSIVQIYPNENGIRESFGIPEKKLLDPGIHFKLPFPYGRIIRIPTNDIQEVFVGMGKKDKDDKKQPEKDSSAILWTVQHYDNEAKFLVASEKAVSDTEVPVSYVSSVFNIQYKIKRDFAFDYYFKNKEIQKTIQTLCESVITKFLAGTDMLKMLALERSSTQKELIKKLQTVFDQANIPIEVIFVNILDVHPPVEKVAPAFQSVVGALEEKETEILNAHAHERKVLPLAEAEASKIIADAETERRNIALLAQSENERFLKQMQAYRQFPSLFKLRTYLDFFETDCAPIRKIILDSKMARNVFILNFEEKQRLDLLDVSISEIAPKKE